jgi:spermidine synthase
MATRSASRIHQQGASTSGLLLICVCFFLSGATALIYEVVWLRMLGLVFGHTVYAATTVLAAFMAGLGLGSVLVGRRAAGLRDPIRAYGVLEVGIGISCALIPLLIWLASFVYLGLHRLLSVSYGLFSFVQFLLVFALLLIPTTLMGGTLPILSQALVGEDGIGRTVGILYGVNTFGAVAGVIVAGYALLPALGNRATLAVAVVANLAVGAAALTYSWRLRRAARDGPRPAARAPARPRAAPEPLDSAARLTLVALGVSGAVSMIYEVAWTRALVLVIGASTYAFTAMLVSFLLGIAGGAAVYSWLWGRRRASPGTFAWVQVGIGLATALVLPLFERLPESVVFALKRSDSPGAVGLMQLAVSAQALLPATLLIGATFPCAVAMWARAPGRAGEDVGRLYASNTLGAIAGAVLAGFVLVPLIGVHGSLKAGIFINLALAAALSVVPLRPVKGWRWGTLSAALVAAVAVVLIPPWDPLVMSSGPTIYAGRYLQSKLGVMGMIRSRELLFYRDGPSATVSVTRASGTTLLQVNGKIDASTNASDMPTQLLSGHLPLLLHRDPQAVLVIGLGSAITTGAIARHPVKRVDVVEIEPAVVEASGFFAKEHGDVLKDPRVRTVIADGRNFLLTASDRYDVIASEPSNPWLSGVASLFSLEFFELARQRLRPGGIMIQWVQAYHLLPEDFRMIVKTFRTVFPATSLWEAAAGDFFLLGRVEPVPVDLNLLKARYEANPSVERDLAGIGIGGWPGLLAYFMLGEEDTVRYTEGAPLNTDDRLSLEFSAPRALYVETFQPNRRLIRSFRRAELPEVTADSRGELGRQEVRFWIGQSLFARGAKEDAARFFRAPGPTR